MEKRYEECFSYRWMEPKRKCINCPMDLWEICSKETARRKRNGKNFRPRIITRLKIEIDRPTCFMRYYSWNNEVERISRNCTDCNFVWECHHRSPVPKRKKKQDLPTGFFKDKDGNVSKISTLGL